MIARATRVNKSLFGQFGRYLGSRSASIRSGLLTLGGLGCFTAGAYQHSLWAGLVATGVSLLTLDWFWSAQKAPG